MTDQLTRFCIDNPELDRLNELIWEFNLFEAAGLRRDEVKHSRFLSFLLNPRESHGLGEGFLRPFLQRAIQASERPDLAVSPLQLELWDLGEVEVLVERYAIDILILFREYRLAVVIENKIGSGEHSDQLNRYHQRIHEHYPGWKVLPLFLSPQGTLPTDERYLPVTYEVIVGLLDHLLEFRSASMGEAVRLTLRHYAQLLRRHVVTDSEIRDLCQAIYRKHKTAIDLIVEHTGGRFDGVRELARTLVGEAGFVLVKESAAIPFLPPGWIAWVPRGEDRTWTNEGFLLRFEFVFSPNSVRLLLWIGPGDAVVRQRLLDAANANKPPFNPKSTTITKLNTVVARMEMVRGQTLDTEDPDQVDAEFRLNWERFLSLDLGRLEAVMRDASVPQSG
jgi:hypothetical protein